PGPSSTPQPVVTTGRQHTAGATRRELARSSTCSVTRPQTEAYERHPKAFYRALASKPGWDAFVRLARGETTLARAGRHRVVRTALATLGAR
ncbi:MAG: hypothetical protein ACKOW5_09470, partial [Actinomycetales bacterium]